MNFLAELRKRNVFRAMAAYLVGAWIMVQVAGFVADAAEMPPWTDSMILILVLMGLPIVFVASWALELTPDGIKKSGSETELEPRPVGPVDYILIAAVVVVLGLFALSQAFALLTSEDEKIRTTRLSGGSLFQGMRELLRHPRIASVSAGFGVIMGMIPGVGEFTAQFMSYTYAQRTSKRPEDFGRGSSEGLIAAETANNAVPAAAMVPLLALGIPGEALTAMMLSVFYVHNVVPGPGLFQNDMDFVVALYIALLILNLLVLAFLLVATKSLIQVVKIPNRFLGVCILTLSFVGVYSLRNSATDCVLAAVFGVLGYILKRLSLPAVPIILGMVLGGIMEVKLRAGMARVKTPLDMIDRPVSFILFLIIVLVLVIHVRRLWLDRRDLKEAEWQSNHRSTSFGRLLLRRKSSFLMERGKVQRARRLKWYRRLMDLF